MNKEKPGCGFCSNTGYAWSTPEGLRICFNCLRKQRNEFRDQCERQAEEIRMLEEAVTNLKGQIHNPELCDSNAAGRFMGLRAELQQLQSRVAGILKGLESQS